MRINLRSLLAATAVALATSTAAFAETDAQLMKEAKITKKQAEQTALTKAPQGKITSEEIERENGKLIWSFDIAKTGTKNHHRSAGGRDYRRGLFGQSRNAKRSGRRNGR